MAIIERVRRNIQAWREFWSSPETMGSSLELEAETSRLKNQYGSDLKWLIEEAERQGREVGVMLCQGPAGEIHISRECWGKRGSVTVTDCHDSLAPIGSFHVHLRGADILSVPDLELAIRKEKLSCVGYMKDGVPTLKCVTPQKYYEYPLSDRLNIRQTLSQARVDIERATGRPLTLMNEQAATPGERAKAALSSVERKLGVYEVPL